MKTDLTAWSDSELTDWTQNDESLYIEYMKGIRRRNFEPLKEMVSELFIFTEDQLTDLEMTFNAELSEYHFEPEK
jgi:ribosomal 50S subunit-associated protein YjgA (DUF615 family)